jgi:hypothetical protein
MHEKIRLAGLKKAGRVGLVPARRAIEGKKGKKLT